MAASASGLRERGLGLRCWVGGGWWELGAGVGDGKEEGRMWLHSWSVK